MVGYSTSSSLLYPGITSQINPLKCFVFKGNLGNDNPFGSAWHICLSLRSLSFLHSFFFFFFWISIKSLYFLSSSLISAVTIPCLHSQSTPIPNQTGLLLAPRFWEGPSSPSPSPDSPACTKAVSHQTTLVARETHIIPVYPSLQVWGCCFHSTHGGWGIRWGGVSPLLCSSTLLVWVLPGSRVLLPDSLGPVLTDSKQGHQVAAVWEHL